MPERNYRDVGGTPGGFGPFLIGLLLVTIGGYLLLNQVTVTGGFWSFGSMGGQQSFGISLLPFLFGVGLLFFDGKSRPGWALFGLGAVVIFSGILANMSIHFRSTSLFNTLVMLVCLAGGAGLVARSMFAFEKAEQERQSKVTRPLE
ncbi:MAG: hypothetical protein HY319_09410 [Armatimonadetes bacterium]|nr:hypothetical protein [Armatimonadota bacterium]